jgi:hypothetical protein
MRRLPGPAGCRLGEGAKLRRLTTNCFGTGRDHKLNHLGRLFGARDSKWMSGPASDAGTTRREALVRRNETNPDHRNARSPERAQRTRVFS